MNFSLVIIRANDGGFVVIDDQGGTNAHRKLLFAGGIDECLAYLKKEMTADRDAPR